MAKASADIVSSLKIFYHTNTAIIVFVYSYYANTDLSAA